MRSSLTAACVLALACALSACGAGGSSSQPDADSRTHDVTTSADGQLPSKPGSVVVGSADFPEAEILAYLYAGAMKANGVKTEVHADIGERTAYMAALKDGSIGAVPEYSGALLNYLSPDNEARAPKDVYAPLRSAASRQDLSVTDYATAQDADTITVTKETAEKYHLSSIGDLKPIAGKLKLGAPAPLQTVSYGVPALEKVYGVAFKQFVSLSPSGTITQTALRNGTVDAADIFSTDPAISHYGFVSLEDTQHIFAAQNVVPVFRRDVLTEPMARASDAVSARLDTAALRQLVTEVADGGDPATVASHWLKQNGLDSPVS
ncbi:ABC transporter substrate-binding protein [Streptomyces chiangmaiensis]|uniref:ABC transporter substrate-binding protein n=1 Tax=Streptomyces chiangmaiensis TaxID=766497 RepID=A0ABU7FVI2_9ACTN|nr:ABC transporter substrate-binding protein [Streptomyces chiangmaiensis]MED7827109.1 ABC transporter substrate-binding protein [Streptomyces chiangmaiensis]